MKRKSILLELGRWAAALAILVCLGVMFGGNVQSSAAPEDVAQAVTAALDMDSMLKADNQMIKRLYGLDPAAFDGCILYYPNTNMMAEELLIVKLRDTAQAETVRTAAEQRLQTQKTTFDGYGVEQYALLTEHSIIEVRGNYVLFVVNAADAAAQKAFENAL